MAKIKLYNSYYFSKVKKMLSSILSDENISLKADLFELPYDFIQNFLPLQLKRKSESYIALDDNSEVRAFITVEAANGNKKKWFIKSLYLSQNSFEEGKQLIDFVVTGYGALGADTFCIFVDEYDEVSSGLFSKMCGFRLCSFETVWKLKTLKDYTTPYDFNDMTEFKNTMSAEVADFYKNSIISSYRFSLEKEKKEFEYGFMEQFLHGKCFKIALKSKNNEIIAYAEISALNKKDRVIDLTVNKPYEYEYLSILKCIINILNKRVKDVNIYVLNKVYMTCGGILEEILENNGFEKIQKKFLFVKDFYKTVKENKPVKNPALIFNEFKGNTAYMENHCKNSVK